MKLQFNVLYHYNGTDIVCVSQAKPEHPFSHAKSCVYVTVSAKTLHVSMQILAYFSMFEIS